MRFIFSYINKYRVSVALAMGIKLLGTLVELMIPYILEHLIDDVVPRGETIPVLFWGFLMIAVAAMTRFLNVTANRRAVSNAHFISYDVRQALFEKTANLTGEQFDAFGQPSLISRMTSDSYNIQSFCQSFQTLMMRAPIMLIGGIAVSLTMDPGLASILLAMVPFMILISVGVSRLGIPMYQKVQEKLDGVVRIMRENITGIRVVKALSKTGFEMDRFAASNDDLTRNDIKASTVMAIPGPFMQLCLNTGLALVVILGAKRVDAGQIRPGVILAFLTYFNMISMGVMGINRIFMMLSKSSASANRISQVLKTEEGPVIYEEKDLPAPQGDEFIRFEHVDFSYGRSSTHSRRAFAGERREQCLYDISFAIKRGESLGIIGPTGCGKSTIINLLMRFYDPDSGSIFIDGRDVRAYEKDDLHRKFGTVFQNDMIFFDTLRQNIRFGRDLTDEQLLAAVEDAAVGEYLRSLPEGLDYEASIGGANLSGGQKQRILVARALAGDPEILVLDDSSSALDYKTDAALRKAIFEHHSASTTIMIAQRVSSIQNMTNILVLDNGRCIGYGSHEHLLETCPEYRDIFETQMGSLA
ncbi:MAG: ABC transporter ATP-binding protein [Lachnospiraceae bacterium]|nr:ABC transporter ATP-binding protein [Lachnospiraceae bacterium]